MARPIKETPILKGNDAKRFIANMNSVKTRKISSEEMKRMRENYSQMKNLERF